MTIEQFDQFPKKDAVLYELNEGEIVTEAAPFLRHDLVRQRVADPLRDFVETSRIGWATIRLGYEVGPRTVRIPDVSFLPGSRVRGIDLDRRIQGAPALAIEVVSPTDLAEDLRRKVEQYLAAGSKSVWVFYPKSREVQVFRADGASFVRRGHDSLEEPELIPGFSLDVSTVFE